MKRYYVCERHYRTDCYGQEHFTHSIFESDEYPMDDPMGGSRVVADFDTREEAQEHIDAY